MAGIECPFCCGFRSSHGELAMQLHIEQHHTDDSPFVLREAEIAPAPTRPAPVPPVPVSQTPSSDEALSSEESMPTDTWTKCTRPGCGQYVTLADTDDHLKLHEVEAMTGEEEPDEATASSDPSNPKTRRRLRRSRSRPSQDQPSSPQKLQKPRPAEKPGGRSAHSLLEYFSGTSYMGRAPRPAPAKRPISEPLAPGRLGKRELGPQAFEQMMPDYVRWSLEHDALPRYTNRIGRDGRLYRETYIVNETNGLVPRLSDLCNMDPSSVVTYLCDPNVKHIVKLDCAGNFCGYWNIQMLLSHIRGRDCRNREELQRVPNILQIQDTIEQAWDNGICPYGRIQTGGVRGTRKWIGTQEAVAYFSQVGVKVEALSFQDEVVDSQLQPAVLSLLDHVEAYYMSALDSAKRRGTSCITTMAPIYFQRFGHSVTIVGVERKDDGSRNLLVFDPSFATSNAMRRLLGGWSSYAAPQTLLRSYRRSEASLTAWNEFEVVVPQPYMDDAPFR